MEKVDKYYQNEGKQIVDALFDAGIFNQKFTRDDMQGLENLLAYYFESNADSVRRGLEFTAKIKHLKVTAV